MSVELLRFYTSNNEEWCYTNSHFSISYGGKTYTPTVLKRDEISFEFDKGTLSVQLPMDVEPLPQFRAFNPAGVVWCDIIRYPEGHNIWFGKVIGVGGKTKEGMKKVRMTSFQTIIQASIPTRTYSPNCPYNLFDSNCTVSRENTSYFIDVDWDTVTVDKLVLTADGFTARPSNYFAFGWIQAAKQITMVTSHVDDTIKVLYPLIASSIPAGTLIRVYAGCNKNVFVCASKFANEANFGGTPFVPTKNYFIDGWK